MLTPVMSPGSRSGVNWMRLLVPATLCAIARASEVLPVPGKSSSSRWPSLKQRDEAEADDEGLAEQHLLDVRDEAAEDLREPGGLFGGHGHLGDVPSGRGQNSCHEYSLV